MATIVKETGAVVSGANSYVTLAEAETIAETIFSRAEWDAATDARKTEALIYAARLLDSSIQWRGYKTLTSNPMQWPRSYVPSNDSSLTYLADNIVPVEVQNAQVEAAIYLFRGDPTLSITEGGVKREKVDVIEVEYFEASPENINRILPKSVILQLAHLGVYVGGSSGAYRVLRT